MSTQTQSKIESLVAELREAERAYYTDGTSHLSDAEFDSLKVELEKLDPNHPYLDEVGAEDIDSSHWEKHTHEFPLGSLGKVNDEAELKKWFNKHNSVIVQPKLDGMSIALTYENGELLRGVTRGKKGVGDDITRNVKLMKGVPHKIKTQEKIVVRGEVLITYEDFYNIPAETRKKNPRNLTTGAAKKLTGDNCHLLTVVVYDVMNNVGLESEGDAYALLEENEFPYIVASQFFEDFDMMMDLFNQISNDRKFYGYDIDGMVIKNTTINWKDDWKQPKDKIAWKFESEQATTTLEGIRVSVSGDRIQPVAKLAPVDCGGVTISAASLHNWERVENLGLRIGCKVLISRRNDVIPQVEEVLDAGNGELIAKPTNCPTCEAALEWEINTDKSVSKFLICPNHDCEAKVTKNIMTWLKRHDTKGVAESTVETLYDNGVFTDLASFLKLSDGEQDQNIVNLEGMGTSKLKTLKEQIANTRKTNPIKFFGGLNFSGSSDGTFERVCRVIHSFKSEAGFADVMTLVLSPFDVGLNQVEGYADPSSKKLQDQFISKQEHIKAIYELVEIEPIPAPAQSSVTGKSFCFTGALDIKRKEAEKMVKDKGGSAKSSVGKDLDYLVTDDPVDPDGGSYKMKKACKLGISIISGEEFMKLIE